MTIRSATARSRTAATLVLGIAAGVSLTFMLATGRADPMGESTSAMTQHGDFIAVWRYNSIHGYPQLIEVVDADRAIMKQLDEQARVAKESFGPDHQRIKEASWDVDRYANQR